MQRTSEELLEVGERTNSPSYAPAPLVLTHGEGARVYDETGREFLDFVGGIAVDALGHVHPELTATIRRQAGRLLHVSNMYYNDAQILLMEHLTARSFADRVFLCNSGAEANEAALKLARRYQKEVRGAPERVEFITMLQSFHGRTYGAISATGQPKYHKGFEPMLPGFHYATFNDLASVEALIGPRTAAVLVEPVQGEGGIVPATREFLEGLRALCDAHGVLLMFDEVQAGIGRTGHLFAYEGYGVTPDVITLAKGLGGGVPVGAMMATDAVFAGWTRGSHATTFGGNPLASAAARCVLEIIERDDLCANALAQGQRLMDGLRALGERFGGVFKDVRGRGLMVGAEVGDDAGALVALCREQGLLINTAGGHTLRFVPPLIISDADVDEALTRLALALDTFTKSRT